MPNKQCLYRSQEHVCSQGGPFNVSIGPFHFTICNVCLQGQQVDAIELVASAIMEKSIDKMEDNINDHV